jgi:opacity protein-like surface antigen
MQNLLTTTAVLGALVAGSSASAQDMTGDWYASVFGGYSNIGSIDTEFSGYDVAHQFDDSYLIGITVGRAIGPNLRTEVELSYATYEGGDVDYSGPVDFSYTSDGDAALAYLLGNVWYDLENASFGNGAVPYVGGGIGVVSVNADTEWGGPVVGYGGTVSSLAYQIGAGVQFQVGTGMIDVAYRLKAARGFDINSNDGGTSLFQDTTFFSNNLQVGYVTKF